MRKFVLGLLALLVCAPAYAQTEFFAHAGDNLNTGATTSRIWCSVVPATPGRGSIAIATNGTVVASDPSAFTGMTVDAIHASNVYKRTGIYYFASASPIRNLGTVTVKTSATAITITNGNQTPMTAVNTTSWGYWVTTCQRLLTASGVDYDPNVWGTIPPAYPTNAKTRANRAFLATQYQLFFTPDTNTVASVQYFVQSNPGWTVTTALTSNNANQGFTTKMPSYPTLLPSVFLMNDTPIGMSIAINTTTTDQDRWIVGIQPY